MSASGKRVLHFGLAGPINNEQVTSGMTKEGVQSKVNEGAQEARDAGYEVQPTFFEPEDFSQALKDLKRELKTGKWDALVFGGGIRFISSLTWMFEETVNAAVQASPTTKLLFQAAPGDLHEVIKRGFQ